MAGLFTLIYQKVRNRLAGWNNEAII